MNIEEFNKLDEKINSRNFHKDYKILNIIGIFLSIFGNLASIFLAYFMLSKIISGANDNQVFVFITSIVLLAGLELLKRNIFDKFSYQFIKSKSFTKEVMPLFILSIFVVTLSFYSSVSGAKEFSSKAVTIDKNKKEIMIKYSDSLSILYNSKLSSIESEIKTTKSKLEDKDKEQTDIESLQPLNRTQKSRVKDLKDERATLRGDIIKLQSDEDVVKKELSDKIKDKDKEVGIETESKKSDNSSNSLAFIILSSIIEITILGGVYFHEYYEIRSYNEKRNLLERDGNYKKWQLYDKILKIIYTEDTKTNQKLASTKAIIDMCKVNDLLILPKELTNLLKVMSGIGIIKTSGSARYINKEKDLAFESLKKHFNID